METAARTAAERRSVRSQFADERVHRYREHRPRIAAARPEQRKTVLRRENAVHIGLGQTQTLHADGENVLQHRLRHRHVPQQAHQSDIETVEEKTVAEERGSVHRERHESGAVQPAQVADGEHAVLARGKGQLSRELDAVGRVHHPLAGRRRERERRVQRARRLRALRQHHQAGVQRDRHGVAAARHQKGGQADGAVGGGRPGVAAAQVRVLHEGHGTHVPVPVPGADHPVPGDAVSQGAQQGDDQRRRVLDHHQHGQGGVSVLRGHGPGELADHARAGGAQSQPERRRRRGHVGADRREFHASPASVVRRRRVGDHVPVPGEHAGRRAGHIVVQGRLAVGQAAHPGARVPGEKRRHNLRHGPHVHVHARIGPQEPRTDRGRDHASAASAQQQAAAAGHCRSPVVPTSQHQRMMRLCDSDRLLLLWYEILLYEFEMSDIVYRRNYSYVILIVLII